MAVAMYTRISLDKTGEAAGVERQAKECRELAQKRNLTIDHVLSDNDISATSGKRRPSFEKLLELVRSGAVDTVLVWHPDRLYRRSRDLELLIDLVEHREVRILSVTAGDFDLNRAAGRAVARTLVAWAGYEVEQKGARQEAAYRQKREHGEWGFTHRPFGYEKRDGKVVKVPEEAEELERVLRAYYDGGQSRRSLMNELNARGILAPTGKPWGDVQLRDLLANGHYAGRVIYNGVDAGPGDWEPIVDAETWRRWQSLAAKRKRKSSFTSARYLLTGIARCDVCGAKMYINHLPGRLAYSCSAKRCVQRSRPALDAFVNALVVARLSRPDAASLLRPAQQSQKTLMDEALDVQSRLDDLAELVADGTLTPDAVREASKPLKKRQAAIQEALAAQSAPIPADLLVGDVAEKWAALPLGQQRTVVRELMDIRVRRVNGKRTFDPSGISVTWRE